MSSGRQREGRKPEPRIIDPVSYPKRWICLIVVAEFLEVDVRTLDHWIDEGRITATAHGHFRRIAREELIRFHGKHRAA